MSTDEKINGTLLESDTARIRKWGKPFAQIHHIFLIKNKYSR